MDRLKKALLLVWVDALEREHSGQILFGKTSSFDGLYPQAKVLEAGTLIDLENHDSPFKGKIFGRD